MGKLRYSNTAYNNTEIRDKVEFHLLLYAMYVVSEPQYSLQDASATALVKNMDTKGFQEWWAVKYPARNVSTATEQEVAQYIDVQLKAADNNNFKRLQNAVDFTFESRYDLAMKVLNFDETIYKRATRLLIIGFSDFQGIQVSDVFAPGNITIATSDEDIYAAIQKAWNSWAGIRSHLQGDVLLEKYTTVSGSPELLFSRPQTYIDHFSTLTNHFRKPGETVIVITDDIMKS